MKLNLIAATVGAIIGAAVVLAVAVGRDVWRTELRKGTGQE